jgi:hypothetical protein
MERSANQDDPPTFFLMVVDITTPILAQAL